MSPGGAAHTKARARATRTRSENHSGPGGTEAEDGASGDETGEAHRSSVSASCVLGTGQALSSRHMASEAHGKGMELVRLEQETN